MCDPQPIMCYNDTDKICLIHYHTLDCINVAFGQTKSTVKFCH